MFKLAILLFLFHPSILRIEFDYMVHVGSRDKPESREDYNIGSKYIRGSRNGLSQEKPSVHQTFLETEFYKEENYQEVLDMQAF